MNCPICGGTIAQGAICPCCGSDVSVNYLTYSTLALVPPNTPSPIPEAMARIASRAGQDRMEALQMQVEQLTRRMTQLEARLNGQPWVTPSPAAPLPQREEGEKPPPFRWEVSIPLA